MLEELTTPRGAFERLREIQLIDCREPYEWEAGCVDNAIHFPLNDILAGAGAGADLDPARPVAVICRSGNRSELATMMFRARGFEAYNLEGGMEVGSAKASRSRLPTAPPAASLESASTPATRTQSEAYVSSPSSTMIRNMTVEDGQAIMEVLLTIAGCPRNGV